ncbi:hypothetical protein F2Q70_00026015 [Brassica cretica]|uniref:DUF4283 domain-containing protein n=1 Tax=Brassica cretica TaxID=69181 RepID=A0A8S9LH29_BRACR|nr:hypothetical protein F2Q70_00026015 [Brassica cretica]
MSEGDGGNPTDEDSTPLRIPASASHAPPTRPPPSPSSPRLESPCFVVGYFIGGTPHVGSIHATVNRIWSSPKAGSKIDVQFIDKNTVLFRIDNNQMRSRVIGPNPEEVLRITLTDPTTEVFPATEVGGWATVYGKSHNESETVEIENQSLEERFATVEDPIVVSPSRFSPLMGIEEEEVAEVEDEVEKGEIPEETGHPINRVSSAAKKSSSSVSHKSSKQKVV